MKRLRRLTFRRKLTLLAAVGILLSLAITGLLLGTLLSRQQEANFAAQLRAEQRMLSIVLQNRQAELLQGLRRVASDNTLQITLDLKIIPQLKKYLTRQSAALGFSELAVLDFRGRPLVAKNDLEVCSADGQLKMVSINRDVLICSGETMSIDENLLGYVIGAVSLNDKKFFDYLQGQVTDHFFLSLADRVILSDLEEIDIDWTAGLPPAGNIAEITLQGHDYKVLTSEHRYGSQKLTVGVLLPLSELQASFWRTILKIGAALTVLSLIILILLGRFIKELNTPIKELTLAAAALADDKYQQINLDCERQDEFGMLNRTFTGMASSLRGYVEKMEQLVTARTKELSDANRALKKDMAARLRAEEEKARLEGQLRQDQKMKALGTMAGGVAHDFNNMLMPILSFTELVKKKFEPGDPDYVRLEEVSRAGLRARDLVDQILVFSRHDSPEKQSIPIASEVVSAMSLVRSATPSSVEIIERIDTACGNVLANSTQLHQLVLNLCHNAVQAMGGKGRLAVSLTRIAVNKTRFATLQMPCACLKVEDSGQGMDVEVQKRIFDPFFTTKEVGEGVGMGLSVVHGIVSSYQGEIEVESHPGKGSVFSIYLPLSDLMPVKGVSVDPVIWAGSEKILLVDDEEQITTAWSDCLQDLGYQVEVARSSPEALELVRSDPEAYDLLVTDQTMPQLSGSRLATEVLQLRADFPIILCSGFSSVVSTEQAEALGIRKFMKKPFVGEDLARAIRSVFDI